MFGGFSPDFSSGIYPKTIARFDLRTMSWTKLGELVTARSGHEIIFNGKAFFVFGGLRERKTEKCTLSGNEF